jgi:2-succinyl-5-enolpyruvyl-6-hydroxy-3-cyclohexene-1-carboxylate synthase
MTPSVASTWSMHFLASLARRGVIDVVVSPGSRSQALALAAYHLSEDADSGLSLHVAIDERTAGFLALGLTVASGHPTVLVCTSGSAAGHYLPAVMEAHHSGLPLIVVTADRPPRLLGVGANQTTRHEGLFGGFAQAAESVDLDALEDAPSDALHRAVEIFDSALRGSANARSGPVHLNVHIDDPLSSPLEAADVKASGEKAQGLQSSPLSDAPRTLRLEPGEGTLVVAGHRAGAEAEQLARDIGAPLIAEVHSGARFGRHLVVAYRELLRQPPGPITRVITVGRPTLSREVHALIGRIDIEQIVWQRAEPESANPSRTALIVDEVSVGTPASPEQIEQWVRPWVEASRDIEALQATEWDPADPDVDLAMGSMKERAQFASTEMGVYRKPLTRRDIARSVWQATWPHDFLLLGSSRMIRECDAMVPGKKLEVWSNRGLSGIDGTIATARGISLDRARSGATGVTRVLMGDLAFLHDAGSLLLDRAEEDAWVQVVVVRDGGGSLFDTLEARETAEPGAFDRVLFSPVTAQLDHIAAGYGWSHQRVSTLGELSEALMNSDRHLIIECVVER